MARNQEVERYKKCFRCQKTNTQHIATSDSDDADILVFSYWCNICKEHFGYRVRIDVVHDKEGRL